MTVTLRRSARGWNGEEEEDEEEERSEKPGKATLAVGKSGQARKKKREERVCPKGFVQVSGRDVYTFMQTEFYMYPGVM